MPRILMFFDEISCPPKSTDFGAMLSMGEFSALSGKSYRQCQRIVARVQAQGMLGVRHRNTGRIERRPPPHPEP